MQEAFRENHGLQCGYLHARHDHDRGRHGEPQGQRPRRPHHPPRARRQPLPLHRLPQHRQGDRGRRQGHGARRRATAQRDAGRSWAKGVIQGGDRHERDRHRRGGAPQRGPALHHRQGPLHRRRQPPGPGARLFPALAACARQDQEHRSQGRRRDAGRARGAHRRRACRRQDRRPHLRLDDPFQGRLADEDGAASGAGARQGQPCRRSRWRS